MHEIDGAAGGAQHQIDALGRLNRDARILRLGAVDGAARVEGLAHLRDVRAFRGRGGAGVLRGVDRGELRLQPRRDVRRRHVLIRRRRHRARDIDQAVVDQRHARRPGRGVDAGQPVMARMADGRALPDVPDDDGADQAARHDQIAAIAGPGVLQRRARRRVQARVLRRDLMAEHVGQAFLVQPQRLGVGLDEAQREGARRQHVVGRLLQRLQIAAPDAGDLLDLVQRPAQRLAPRLEDIGEVETVRVMARRLQQRTTPAAKHAVIRFVLDRAGRVGRKIGGGRFGSGHGISCFPRDRTTGSIENQQATPIERTRNRDCPPR